MMFQTVGMKGQGSKDEDLAPILKKLTVIN